MPLPHSALDWSAVCNCGISLSYSYNVCICQNHHLILVHMIVDFVFFGDVVFVPFSFVITCWERADLFAVVFVVYLSLSQMCPGPHQN